MENFNQTILIAIISSMSAILGSLTPNLIALFLEKYKRKNELEKDLLTKQKEIYQRSIYALQDVMNDSTSSENIHSLQKAVLDISIYGDDETSKNFNNFFNELVDGSTGIRKPLTAEEHEFYQLLIINSIRKKMGNKSLKSFRIISFIPPKRK